MDIAVIKRIAERGLKYAQAREDSAYCDLFQHMLDEIEYLDQNNNLVVAAAFRKFAEKVHDPKIKEMSKPDALALIATEIAEELEVESVL